MNRIELTARNVLRRLGLAGPILRVLRFRQARAYMALRASYELTRPPETLLRVGEVSARLIVSSADEYAHYMSLSNDETMLASLRFIRPGDVCWDIGANIGMYSLLMASVVGPKGKVLAFEPMKSCFERLTQNVLLNAAINLEPVKLALGAESREMRLAVDGDGLEGDHRLVGATQEASWRMTRKLEVVQVIPGDQLRTDRGLSVPNLLKIDVQGAEGDVLRGLTLTLRDPACRVVIIEIHFKILEESGRSNEPVIIEKLLHDCGFHRIERLDMNHIAACKD